MCCNAHREHVHHSQREGLTVGFSTASVSDRTVRPVVERGRKLNIEHAQIRTALDRQREQIIADSQAEIKRHEFQANCDRRKIPKSSETLETQQEELHRAQAAELHWRDQQLLHAQLLQQNWESCEARDKSQWNVSIDEVSEFNFRHYCKTKINRGLGYYFGTCCQHTGFSKWY